MFPKGSVFNVSLLSDRTYRLFNAAVIPVRDVASQLPLCRSPGSRFYGTWRIVPHVNGTQCFYRSK
jgi:hypothetical protein